MKEIGIFILGILVGGWISTSDLIGGDSKVYLNGGSFSSSTIGVVYGYANDFEGCSIHAAGMNFYYQSDATMQKQILAAKGNSFCSFEAIR